MRDKRIYGQGYEKDSGKYLNQAMRIVEVEEWISEAKAKGINKLYFTAARLVGSIEGGQTHIIRRDTFMEEREASGLVTG